MHANKESAPPPNQADQTCASMGTGSAQLKKKNFKPSLSPPWAILGQLGAILRPPWGHLKPPWGILVTAYENMTRLTQEPSFLLNVKSLRCLF